MASESTPHILIVEDESALSALLKENLKIAGYTTHLCKDGEEGWNVFQKERFDLCLLDINMPKKNGYELAKLIREDDAFTPIIFLTANTSEEDKLKGFGLGADEYITKPFSSQELVARIKAVLKRTSVIKPEIKLKEEIYEIGHIKIDLPNHLVYFKDTEKKISSTEGELLKLFIKNKNQLLTRNSLLLSIWGHDDFYTARNLDVYINKLRNLLKAEPGIEIINIHGSGFKLIENKTS